MAKIGSWDLVEHFFDASVSQERLDELIAGWDAQIGEAGTPEAQRLAEVAGPVFARQVAVVLEILEQLQAAETQRIHDLLSEVRTAALVLTGDGEVVAANEPARIAFGSVPGGSIRAMPFETAEIDRLAARLGEVAGGGDEREGIVQLRPLGSDRRVIMHLKYMGSGPGRSRVLAITSEQVWPERVSALLARAFGMTPAEVDLLRLLSAGSTVGGIATATGRSAGTVRSQLHSTLQKTGARNQAEVVRLAWLLIESASVETEPRRRVALAEPHERFMSMPDGRRVEVLTWGDPSGRPVIWLPSPYGMWRLPEEAELGFARSRLRVIVPLRAGYRHSDPPPRGRNLLEVAVEDLRTVMTRLRIASAPVVAPADDIRIALMLAQAEPDRVRAIIGIGCSFPIRDDAQYRRLMPIARFVRACARYTPQVLPFMLKVLHSTVARRGIAASLREIYARSPADARAFDQPGIAEARIAAVDYMWFHEGWSAAAFSAEMLSFHKDWPASLGDVACPVTLIHGEQDGNSPFETALEYAAMYPAWRFTGYPDEGELIAHARWPEVLALIEEAYAPLEPPHRGALPLPV